LIGDTDVQAVMGGPVVSGGRGRRGYRISELEDTRWKGSMPLFKGWGGIWKVGGKKQKENEMA